MSEANSQGESMRYIDIDASPCRNAEDFSVLLRKAIGSPDWHGGGPDAFVDSMIWGGIDAVEPPYTVRISGTKYLSPDVKASIGDIMDSVSQGRRYHREHAGSDVDVNIEIVS